MIFRKTLLAAACTLALAFISFAVSAQTQLTDRGEDFIRKLSIGNMFEIQAGEVAIARSQRQDVRRVADILIADHRKNAETIKSVITVNNINVTPPMALDREHDDKIVDLKEERAETFNRAYIDGQIAAHEETIAMFEDYVDHGNNRVLRNFAVDTLPTLRQHLALVQNLAEAGQANP